MFSSARTSVRVRYRAGVCPGFGAGRDRLGQKQVGRPQLLVEHEVQIEIAAPDAQSDGEPQGHE